MARDDTPYDSLTPEEIDFWEEMMGDVSPLKKDKKNTNQGRSEHQVDDFDDVAEKNQPTPPLPADLDYFDAFVAGKITLDDIPDAGQKLDTQLSTAETPKTLPTTQKQSFKSGDAPLSSKKTPFVVAENSPHKLAGWRAGTPKKTMQMLAKGKPVPTLDVDLHGFTLHQAYAEIRTFLAQATEDSHKCVLIIHGKGRREGQDMGAIKQNLAGFLAERPEVLAFHTAHAKHGGSGACYVLLKRAK